MTNRKEAGSSQRKTQKWRLSLFSSPFFPALGSFLCRRVAIVHVRDKRLPTSPHTIILPIPLTAMKHSKVQTKTALQHHRSVMCCTTRHDKLRGYLDNTRKSRFFTACVPFVFIYCCHGDGSDGRPVCLKYHGHISGYYVGNSD